LHGNRFSILQFEEYYLDRSCIGIEDLFHPISKLKMAIVLFPHEVSTELVLMMVKIQKRNFKVG
jgi:hypothetical protein